MKNVSNFLEKDFCAEKGISQLHITLYALLKYLLNVPWQDRSLLDILANFPSLLNFVKRFESEYPMLSLTRKESLEVLGTSSTSCWAYELIMALWASKPKRNNETISHEDHSSTSLITGFTVGCVILITYMSIVDMIRIK